MSDFYGLPNPENVVIRPLNKGMITDGSPNMVPDGAFTRIQNYLTTAKGLKRRPGFSIYCGGNQISSDDWPLQGVAALWMTDGTNAAALISSRYLYRLSGFSVPEQIYWTYAVGTCSVSGTTMTGSETEWNTDTYRIQAGDVVILDADGTPEEVIISSINSDTEIILTSAPTGTYGAGTDYIIRRRFQFDFETSFDYTIVDNTLLIADHNRTGLYAYNGTTLDEWSDSLFYIPGCVTFAADRVWIGNIIEEGEYCRQRIRWSSTTDHTDFNDADFYDIPYTDGFLRRLLPLDRLLIAYFQDAIYVGRASNLTDLPYQFDASGDSGKIGLVGTRAVTVTPNGHYFVGQDDVYFINNVDGLVPLDCPVKDEMIAKCTRPERIYAITDLANDRVIFGFPRGGEFIERLWSYNYKLRAWSYDPVDAQFIAAPHIDLQLAWDDLPALLGADDDWDTGMAAFGSWDAISGPVLADPLFMSNIGYIYYLNSTGTDDNGQQIVGVIETGDIDFGEPDMDKTVSRLTLRLSARTVTGLRFSVSTSLDSGYTWETQGSIIIPTDGVEGKINFCVTGSTVRIRLTESTVVESYEIIELSLRVLKRGKEYEFD